MNILRRFAVSALATVSVAGVASADNIISYTTTVTDPTELVNIGVTLPAWNPGGVDTTPSDSSSFYAINQTGVTMASLDAANTTYNLVSYDVYVNSTLVGTYQGTAGANGANGNFSIQSYTALSLGSTMPTLTATNDASNDLFYRSAAHPSTTSAGGTSELDGPNNVSLAANTLSPVYQVGGSTAGTTDDADYGCTLHQIALNKSNVNCDTPTFISSGLSNVEGSSPLQYYFSTLTTTSSTFTGSGNIINTFTTSVIEDVTIAYDYTTTVSSGTPEPTTMVLFGSALVGLGLLRKRTRA